MMFLAFIPLILMIAFLALIITAIVSFIKYMNAKTNYYNSQIANGNPTTDQEKPEKEMSNKTFIIITIVVTLVLLFFLALLLPLVLSVAV